MPIPSHLLSLPALSRKFLILLMAVLVGLSVLVYCLARPLVRSASADVIPGARNIVTRWLPDAANTGGLSIAQIAELDRAGAFVPMPPAGEMPILNSRSWDGRWFFFEISNSQSEHERAVLDLVWQNYDLATLYRQTEDGRWITTTSGGGLAPSTPGNSRRMMAFDLLLTPRETQRLYLHVQDFTRLPDQFLFWPRQDDFLAWERFEFAKSIGMICLLIPLIAYGMFAYATLHQRDHLDYVGIVVLTAAYRLLAGTPSWLQVVWLNSPWHELALGTLSVLIHVCYCRFTRSIFDLPKKDPACDRWARRVQWSLLGCAVLLPLPFWPSGMIVTVTVLIVIIIVVELFLLGVGLRRWRAGVEQAPFFVLSLGVIVFARIQVLVSGPQNLLKFDEQVLITVLCLGVGLLGLALANAYRHRLVLREHLVLRSTYTRHLEEDVKERTRVLQTLSERLSATVAERDRILAIIGHDLRGPASSLQSLGRILAHDAHAFSPAEMVELAHDIEQTCAMQLELLNSLLTWGEVHAGQARKPQSVAVREIVAAAWKPVATLAQEKNIQFTDTCPSGVHVLADVTLIQTILRNLLANAIKFTRAGGHIEAGGRLLVSRQVELWVRDDGVGIAPERLRTLLSGPVESQPGTQEEQGAGVGLSLCRDLARAVGGTLRLESEPGKGTTAFLTLPAAGPR